MKSTKNLDLTYILEQVSPAQQNQITAHMNRIGLTPTPNPAIFEALSPYDQISASSDILDTTRPLPLHSHTFMEFIYYASGSGIDYLIGTHRYRLQKGDIVFVPPGVCHCTLRSSNSPEPCIRYSIVFKNSFIDINGEKIPSEISSKQEYPYLLRTTGTDMEYLGTLFELCVQEAKNQKYRWRDMLNGFAQILMAQIGRACREEAPMIVAGEKGGLFEKILSYIDDNLSSKLTLANTAKVQFASERTINRVFQQNLGISFYRYVTQRRLEMAKNLILENIPIESVCAAVGFSDYSAFYRAFKKEYGLSPRQMHRLNQQQTDSI